LAIPHAAPDRVAAALRSQPVPVVCRIQQEQLLFDPRTVLPGQEGLLLQGLLAALQPSARQEEIGCSSF